jgi:type IV pilus assembly protein PilM
MDLSSFSNIFSSKPQSVLGVDIGSSSIKVVQLKREKGKAVLETYGAIALGPYGGIEIGRATALPAEKISEALAVILKEANVTTSDACFAIPYSSSLVTVVKLPPLAESHLDETMPLEARKYVPVPINEVKLDWSIVKSAKGSKNPNDKVEVLLVALHNETLEKYRRIAESASLTASFFEIEVFSTVRAALDHGIAPVAIVDFGAAITKFYVVERGIVRESHTVNHGSQELTLSAARALNVPVAQAEEHKRKEGLGIPGAPSSSPMSAHATGATFAESFELALGPLLSDVSHAIAAFEARMNEPISGVVFSGGGSTLKGFSGYAQSKLQAEVRIADPFGKTEAPAFLSEILKEAGPEFSVAVGLALRRLQDI